jgi:hypothetical protein
MEEYPALNLGFKEIYLLVQIWDTKIRQNIMQKEMFPLIKIQTFYRN